MFIHGKTNQSLLIHKLNFVHMNTPWIEHFDWR